MKIYGSHDLNRKKLKEQIDIIINNLEINFNVTLDIST